MVRTTAHLKQLCINCALDAYLVTNIFPWLSGTVPLHSLLCVGNKWRNANHGKSFTEKPYSLCTHAGILKDVKFIQDVIGYLL